MKCDDLSFQLHEQIFLSYVPMGHHDFSSGPPGNGVILQSLRQATASSEAIGKPSRKLPCLHNHLFLLTTASIGAYIAGQTVTKGAAGASQPVLLQHAIDTAQMQKGVIQRIIA